MPVLEAENWVHNQKMESNIKVVKSFIRTGKEALVIKAKEKCIRKSQAQEGDKAVIKRWTSKMGEH